MCEWRALGAGDAELWVEASLRLATLDGEQRLLITARDIGERKRAEQERRELQERLLQAQRLEAVGRLAGGIAHDFNNLLTGILGHASLTMATLPEEDRRYEWMRSTARAAESAGELTSALLAFSRRQVIEPRVLRLDELVEGMRTLLDRTLGEDVTLRILAPPGLAPVHADPGQLEHVLVNLAVNARDAMPDGGKLMIETANVSLDEEYCRQHVAVAPGDYVMLAVSDTGCGMTPAVKRAIFEPFFTTKPKGKGTGLGLAMVFGAVRQHGGTIEVYSEVGRGTTFKIYLPRAHGEVSPLLARSVPRQLPAGHESVVVVEDNEFVRELATEVLGRAGYRVQAFADAEAALSALAASLDPVHLLLTDVVLAGKNGRELAEELRAARPALRVLFTSGYTQNVIVHHGMLEPGIQFLGKPFTPEALAEKVRALLDEETLAQPV